MSITQAIAAAQNRQRRTEPNPAPSNPSPAPRSEPQKGIRSSNAISLDNGTGTNTTLISPTVGSFAPDVTISDEINGRNSIFGGVSGTITVSTGTNACATILGGQHQPINEGTGTNLPK